MQKPIHLFKPNYSSCNILVDLAEIMMKGWTGLGGKTTEFEKIFAEEVKAKYAVGVNSCTAALQLALKAVRIEPKDEIITTPISFVSTNHVILYEQAIPVFCDIDIDMNINAFEIAKLVTSRTKAIMVVHYAGQSNANMELIYEIANEYDLWVIEDCAHACGAYYKDTLPVGSNPYKKSLSCFSFHAVKNLSLGDGGMVTTNSKVLAERMKKLRWLGIDRDTYSRTESKNNIGYNWMYSVEDVGLKCHMNDIQAVIGIHQIKNLLRENSKRKKIVEKYIELIEWGRYYSYIGQQAYNDENDSRVSANHLFVIRVANRDKLVLKMNENNIFPGVHYFPNHLYTCYKPYTCELSNAETFWRQVISLPLHTELENKHIERICNCINSGW